MLPWPEEIMRKEVIEDFSIQLNGQGGGKRSGCGSIGGP